MDEIKILLEKNFILKEEQRELYYSIKDHYKQIKPFIVDKLGYELIIRSDFIRLEKRPGKAESWMGIKEFEDQQAYVFFMLLMMFLEDKNKEDQFLLSHITDYIAANAIGEEVDWTQYKIRRRLIKVLQVALSFKLIKTTDGEEGDFIQDASKEVLFESTGLSRYFVRTFHSDVMALKSYKDLEVEKEDILDQEKGVVRKNRVYRKLLLSPIVYRQGSHDEDYAYIKNYHHIIEEDFRKYLGWTIQLHRNGALAVPQEQDKISYPFPSTSALSDIMLQFNGLIKKKLLEGKLSPNIEDTIVMDKEQFKQLTKELIDEKAIGWSKEYREADKERVDADLLQALRRFKMAEVKQDKVILLPLIGKIIGDYPADFVGGQLSE